MTSLGLNAGAARTGRRAAPISWAPRGRRRASLLAGVSLVALAASAVVSPAMAAAYTASTEAEFNTALTDAQASADATSTITLTGSFSLTAAPTAVATKNITIDTGANTLTLASGAAFDVTSGATLTISGNVLGNGVLNQALLNKTGAGDLVINGVSATGVSHIGANGGILLIDGGSNVAVNAASGGTTPLIAVAKNVGETATLTISGAGTVVTGTGTDTVDIGNISGSGTLNVEAGGVLTVTTSSLRQYGNSNINVSGADSAIYASTIVQSTGAVGTIDITDGGLISSTNAVTLGGVGNVVQNATVDGTVSGAGSKLEVGTTLYLQRGTLSVLDGGVVEANAVAVAAASTGTAIRDFDILVSGDGSELNSATTFILGTRGSGTLTIADDGTVVIADGAGTLEMGGTNVASAAMLNIGGAEGEAAAAAGTLDAAAITLATSAVINFNHTDTDYVFDTAIFGDGGINQLAGHTIFNADQLDFTGLTTISGGMLEVNGAIGGMMHVAGGMLSGTGTVGDTTLQAAGTISPGGDDIGTLTVDGDYVSAGGTLQIQTVLGDDSSATDLLVITGSTSGATNVAVTNVGGVGGATVNGIKIVDVAGTSAGTFALVDGDLTVDGQEALVAGAYLYGLYQGTLTDADGDWYLRNITNPDDGTALFQPTAPVAEAYAGVLQSFNRTETLQQRVGNRSWSSEGGENAEGNGVWGRVAADHASIDPDSSTGASYDVDTWRLQAGIDGVLNQSGQGTLVAGFNAQVATVSADIASSSGNGSIDSTGYGIGASLTWYGSQGFYLDAQGKLTWFDSELNSDALGTLVSGNQGFGSAVSVEAGQKIALGDDWSITPQGQLSYSAVDYDDFTDPYGSSVALADGDSLIGRVGISVDYESAWQDAGGKNGRTHAYGIANVSYEFLEGTSTSIGTDTLASAADPLWGSLGLGASLNWADDQLSLYGEASLGTSLNNPGDSTSVGLTAGLRGKF